MVFFGYHKNRQTDDIETLWEVFGQAVILAKSDTQEARSAFIAAYDNATGRYRVGWNLTMGLYWIRPWRFATLNSQSRDFIGRQLDILIRMNGHKGRCNGVDYLTLLDTIETQFKDEDSHVRSFPALSLAAWKFNEKRDYFARCGESESR